MDQTKQIWKNYLIRMAFVFAMFGFCFFHKGVYVHAEETSEAAKVEIESIDYEKGTIQINAKNNTKVYYSDSSKKTWNVIEGAKSNDRLTMDISWISAAKDYELNLKGSDDETVVTVELPKYNSTVKATFDKVDGTIDFTNEQGATQFEWKKAIAMDEWKRVSIDSKQADAKEFLNQVETMRVKGGKIQVRLPQTVGTSDEQVGSRPSKILTINVAKRGGAPSVKVVANSMKVNTTNKLEYKLVSVDGSKQTETKWIDCEKNMTLSEIAPQVITVSGGATGKDVTIAVRKAETEKVAYSKTNYLVIPAQPSAPDPSKFSTSKTSSKFSLIIGDASTANQYQYAVLAAGETKAESDLKWKVISSSKEISFASNKYPVGSVIYVRTKGENLSKKTALKLPSAYTTVSISYLTETKE